MKLLIIDEEFPYPLNTGKRIRSFNLAKALSQIHEISYMAYGSEKTSAYEYLHINNLNPIAISAPDRRQSGLKFYGRLLLNIFSGHPYIVTSHYTDRFQDRLKAVILDGKFDFVICEWTPYAVFIKSLSNVKKIIVAHNIESAIWQGYYINEKNFLKKLYISNQVNKVNSFENNCFKWADGATAVSANDAEYLRQLNLKYPVEVIDNGVDTEYFEPQNTPIDPHMLVFTGSMDWRPNQDAAIYFAHEIFPILKETKPEIKATFVGRDPSRKVRDLELLDGIFVTGTVDDVRPYIARASVYIVPLRIGGGSRLKILEAMAMGKAVVSTTIGAEGLNVADGFNISLKDKPEDFAGEIVRLLDDRESRNMIAENGRKTVAQYYQWKELGKKLSDYICKIAQNH